MNVSAFGRLIAIPHVPGLMAAALLGRLPSAVAPVTIVLAVHDLSGSYAAAGLASACYAVAAGLAGPALGRLIDRRGQTAVLPACAVVSSAGWVGIAVATSNGMAVVLGCCALAGAFQPPLASCMRALWPALVREPEGREAAYALESTSQELLYISGPLLLAGVVGVASPRVAAAAWATFGLAGTLLFAAGPPSRARSARETRSRRHWAGALADAGIRWLLAIKVVWMISVGMLLVAVAAFCGRRGSGADVGVIIAVWGAASMAAGIVYGGRRWRSSLQARFVVLLAALAATAFPLALARSTVELALLFGVFGLGLAPWLASADALTQAVAPPGTLTEAFTWGIAAGLLGQALGGSLAGALLDTGSPGTAFLAAATLLLLAAAVAAVAVRRIPSARPGSGGRPPGRRGRTATAPAAPAAPRRPGTRPRRSRWPAAAPGRPR
jgi:MFS family permease